MKKTNIILINAAVLLAGTTLSQAETKILNFTTTQQSYDASNVTDWVLSTTQTTGNTSPATNNFTFDGKTISATFGASGGAGRRVTADNTWTGGLSETDASALGLSSSDISAITSSYFYTVSSSATSSYTGYITLVLSGLSAGSYSLSWLMAGGDGTITPQDKPNTVEYQNIGGLGPTTWNVYTGTSSDFINTSNNNIIATPGGTKVDSANFTYTKKVGDAAWETVTGTNTTDNVTSGTASAHYMTVTFDIEEGTDTIALHAEKWDKGAYPYTMKNLSFVALSTVPEPSAFGMLAGMGALALAVARRRRPSTKA